MCRRRAACQSPSKLTQSCLSQNLSNNSHQQRPLLRKPNSQYLLWSNNLSKAWWWAHLRQAQRQTKSKDSKKWFHLIARQGRPSSTNPNLKTWVSTSSARSRKEWQKRRSFSKQMESLPKFWIKSHSKAHQIQGICLGCRTTPNRSSNNKCAQSLVTMRSNCRSTSSARTSWWSKYDLTIERALRLLRNRCRLSTLYRRGAWLTRDDIHRNRRNRL